MLLAIDPGPVESACVLWDGTRVLLHWKRPNAEMIGIIRDHRESQLYPHLAIEMIACYGMPVGAEVFETCVWIGRFMEAWGGEVTRIPRLKVKSHLCHSAKANDGNIRQALIDRLGPPGRKATPGPTFGIAGDEWAALAVAVTVWDQGAQFV
jgi:hypothetical protein